MAKEKLPEDLIAKKKQERAGKAISTSGTYISKLIVVAITANELVGGAEKSSCRYFCVSKQRFHALKLSLEVLRKHRQ
ncbi:MAG: hypothetical protein FVQ80_08260 [Planctomycetes bacterium]|nr:hypothetical protein [Planctomycetota bacterium]